MTSLSLLAGRTVCMVRIISENAPNPPASSGWLFKKPADSHDKFLDASSLMNVFNFTDKVKIYDKANMGGQ